jgi:hypothetical protein
MDSIWMVSALSFGFKQLPASIGVTQKRDGAATERAASAPAAERDLLGKKNPAKRGVS